MEEQKKGKTIKAIIKKYRFEELQKLDKDQIIKAYFEVYDLYEENLIKLGIAENKNFQSEKKEQRQAEAVNYSGYDSESGGIEKVIFILNRNQKLMRSNEIEKILLQLQPTLAQNWINSYNAVIRYITRAVKYQTIIKQKIGGKFWFGLPDWFDDKGQLKQNLRR